MAFEPRRPTYKGRPTKWVNLNRFYEFRRTLWPELRKRQQAIYLEGKLSAAEYLEALNLTKNPSWMWIEQMLLKASKKKDPMAVLGQLNIQMLEDAIGDLNRQYKYLRAYTTTLEETPLEECTGYVFNRKFSVTREERQEVIDHEADFTEEIALPPFKRPQRSP